MAELQDGSLLIVGYERTTGNTLHRFDRRGVLIRGFRPVSAGELSGFETSLIGGHIDVLPSGDILFTQLSPYVLEIYSPEGELRWRCQERGTLLSEPSSVVESNDQGSTLRWGRFVHSGSVFALSDTLFLNIVTDPANDRRQFDLVSRSCRLLSRQTVDAPFLLTKRTPDRTLFVGGMNVNEPQVVVYRLRP